MNMIRKGAAVLLAVLMVSVMAVGCGNNQEKAAGSGAGQGSSSQQMVPSGAKEASTGVSAVWSYTDQTGMQEDAQAAFDKAFETYTASSVFHPIALLGTQVVAGTNYAILMSEAPSENPDAVELKVVTIYQDLQGNCTVQGFVDMDLDKQYEMAVDKASYDESTDPGQEMLAGGWTPHLGGPELTEEAASHFSAYETLEEQKMMVYVGSATAENETIYAAVKAAKVSEDGTTGSNLLCFVTVKDGAETGEKVIPINIADYSSYGEFDE